MLGVLLALALVAPNEPQDCERVRCSRARGFRADAPRRALALFEFAPAEGWGLTPTCACTSPTGAKGEVLTFTRASSAVCTKGNWSGSIADGDLVTCSTDQPRVMPGGDGSGGNGLFIEDTRTNTCLRGRALCNAAWSDVGTPSCSADQATGPFGQLTMDQFTDNDGAAIEGRSQSISTTSATKHSFSCYVKAGTATSASLTLTGTGSAAGDCSATATGLSSTTSTRISCTSPAAYAGTLTAVTVAIGVGSQASDTGTLFVEACEHEVSAPFPSSYVDTDGSAAARAVEVGSFALPVAMNASTGSHAVTFVPEWSTSSPASPYLLVYDSSARMAYDNGGDSIGLYDGVNDTQNSTTFTAGTPKRIWTSYTGVTATANDGADTTTGTFDGTMGAAALSTFFVCNGAGVRAFGVCKRVCGDPDTSRCR